MESPNKCQENSGFTLVELSIVMIIIGLLIGGIFGGMKLIDSANVQKTVQEIKSTESAILTFKDTFRSLPGDIRNPSARIPNCADAPCSTAGNGDRSIGPINNWNSAITDTSENFTFWHHLQAANLISMDFHNTTDMSFGEGQPNTPLGGTYRMLGWTTGSWAQTSRIGHIFWISNRYSEAYGGGTQEQDTWKCSDVRSVDVKLDDGRPTTGRFVSWGQCPVTYNDINSDWSNNVSGKGAVEYFLAF